MTGLGGHSQLASYKGTMDSARIILKPQITKLTVTLSAGIREMVQLFLYYCSKIIRFKASGN